MPSSRPTYRLSDDWAGRLWTLQAARFAHAADVAADAGGRVFILDRRQQAVHILAEGHDPEVFRLPAAEDGAVWTAERIDASADGMLFVLAGAQGGSRGSRSAVERLDPSGRRLARFSVDLDYNDIAVAPDGRLFLSRTMPAEAITPPPRERPPPSKGGVDIWTADGARLSRLDDRPLFYPSAVDVDGDGTVYVVNRIPSPDGADPPGPAPTPPPSRLRAPADAGDLPPVAGVVIYDPPLVYRETVPFNAADDVTAGPAGVFVARNVEIFALRETESLFAGPIGGVHLPYGGQAVLHLAAPPGGGLVASVAHCYFQGLARLPDPARRPAQVELTGSLDRPPLAGPIFPMRLAAGPSLALLQGRFALGDGSKPFTGSYTDQPQSIQRWSADGRLLDQLGLCGGVASLWFEDLSETWWTRDLALDGSGIWTIDRSTIALRPGPGFPAWTRWAAADDDPGAGMNTQLQAVSTEAGRAALLDTGAGLLRMVDRTGRETARWPLGEADAVRSALPVDLALAGDRVYLAEHGAGRVRVLGDDGAPLGTWPLHDGPLALDAGPEGDLYVLGRGGWGLRYDPAGQLLALWRLPRAGVASDIAVGDDGRIFVAHVERAAAGLAADGFQALREPGIWVFAPGTTTEPPDLRPGGCLAEPDKSALPEVLPLGETVEVRLTVDGACPARAAPLDLVIVFDRSRSMNADSALDRAKDRAHELLAGLDPASASVSLVSFSDGAALEMPPGRDLGALASRIAGLEATGDTRAAAALDLARQVLAEPGRDPGTRRAIVVIGDADFKDDIRDSAAAVRAEGVDLSLVVVPTRSFDWSRMAGLTDLFGADGQVIIDPTPAEMAGLAGRVAGARAPMGLFASAVVTDRVPANMRYIEGSAEPPARFDAASRTLTWRLGPSAPGVGIRLRYRLQPQEVGLWPTNVEARAATVDAYGLPGKLVFPVPRVKVWNRASLSRHAYLPFIPNRACLPAGPPLDIVLAMDSSESMGEGLAAGGTKLDAARRAALELVGRLDPARDRVAVVAFNAGARRVLPFSGDREAVVAALAGLTVAPGTRIDAGLRASAELLAEGGRPGGRGVVILLTDGLQAEGLAALHEAAAGLRVADRQVFTIGLGEGVDRALLAAIASRPDAFYPSPSAADLEAIYQRIAERLACDGP